MLQLRYIGHVLSGIRLSRLKSVLDEVHEKSGQSRVYTFFDMLHCAIRYGAAYHDYLIFAFYDMDAKHRDTYVTRLRNKKILSLLNDPQYEYLFTKKNEFDRRFRAYLGRDFRDVADLTYDDFAEFMAGKRRIFAKPNVGESGSGIERLEAQSFAGLRQMYDYVKDPARGFGVIEEELIQHPALSKIYPCSINTYRIVTLVAEGVAHCVYAAARFGNNGKFVDNAEKGNGGVYCPIDQEREVICGVAHASDLTNYDRHPYTGVLLLGYPLPFVQEAVALVKRAAMEVPQIGFVGWDVAITPDGPVLVEGNVYPGHDFWQLPEHTPDRIGLWPYYKKLLPQLS